MQLQELFFFATTIIIVAPSLRDPYDDELSFASYPAVHPAEPPVQSICNCIEWRHSVCARFHRYKAFQATYLWGRWVHLLQTHDHGLIDGWMNGRGHAHCTYTYGQDGIWQRRHVSRLSVREYSLNEATAETFPLHMNPFINWRIWKCP